MASPSNTDALGLLSAALSSRDPNDEAAHLNQLFNLLRSQPGNIPILLPSLIQVLPKAADSLRRWIADVMDLAFCRPTLSSDTKQSLAVHTPDAILTLLSSGDRNLIKIAEQCFASVYAPLFRLACNDQSKQALWRSVEAVKAQIFRLYDAGSKGAKVAAIKCFQRIIQVQTRAPSDPRAQGKGEVSLSMVPAGHRFLQPQALEEEGNRLLTQIVTLVFTSAEPDLVMATVHVLSTLAKVRPPLANIVLEAMASWTPAALASLPHTQVRNVEKTVRTLYFHFLRNQIAGAHTNAFQKALETQKKRMEEAARAYQERKEVEAKRKRDHISEELDPKRLKVAEQAPQAQGSGDGEAFRNASMRGAATNPLASFDVKTLPINLVIELIVTNLQALSDADLQSAIGRMRDNLGPDGSIAGPSSNDVRPPPPGAPPAPLTRPFYQEPGAAMDEEVEAQPVLDPLKMDVGEDEELADIQTPPLSPTADRNGVDGQDDDLALVGLDNFALAAPEYLSAQESEYLIKDTISRMCDIGLKSAPIKGLTIAAEEQGKAAVAPAGPQVLWATLITRLATRGFAERVVPEGEEEESSKGDKTVSAQADTIRKLMLEFLKVNFADRVGFAVSWLAEEWHCDRIRRKAGQPEQYAKWLQNVVEAWIPTIDAKDKTLALFLADLPQLPQGVIDRMGRLCRDKTKSATAMSTLQDIILTRPPIREQASERLLELTRATDKTTRARAIISIKYCAGQSNVLEGTVLAFARSSLDLLKATPPEPAKEQEEEEKVKAEAEEDVKPANGDTEEVAVAESTEEEEPSLYPKDEEDVLRFVELPFSLCTKVPDMLDEIFVTYPKVPAFIQEAIQKHIVNLIRALGPNNPRLLTLLGNFPEGADSLALCVFKILSEKGRTPTLVALVKGLVEQRNVDPRFLVPIMPDLDKAEIIARLPKVVTILGSKSPEDKALLKSVFQSIVTMPPQGFGSVSSNLPRVRQTELLTPVELMGLLHRAENEIGLTNASAAVQICFSMTDVFRSEVLGAVLNQILEEPTLPVLFMRTVIMAVSTYKSLSGYVSKNLLSRLITKKIWQNAPLWKGFILCAKLTAPSSFGALIQLPKEQLREVVSQQPELKAGLVDYLTQKAGGNRARLAAFMDLLGADEPSS